MSDQPADPNPLDRELDLVRAQVETNPTDLLFRFHLGECLFRLGRYREAIPELQKSRSNPNCRKNSMRLIVEAFDAIGMHELASNHRKQLNYEFPDEEGPGGAGVPARLNPILPRDMSAAKQLPTDDEDNQSPEA